MFDWKGGLKMKRWPLLKLTARMIKRRAQMVSISLLSRLLGIF